jgi:Putative hemolysin
MKKIIFLGLALVSLTACSAVQHKELTPPKIGSPNPASKYCVDQGGKLEIRNEANGQVGLLSFAKWSSGRRVEIIPRQPS